MSEWMNRVLNKPKLLPVAGAPGRSVQVFPYKFAYQPYRSGGMFGINDRMDAKYLGPTYRMWKKKGNPDALVGGNVEYRGTQPGTLVFELKGTDGAFYSGTEHKYVGLVIEHKGKPAYVEMDYINGLIAANTGFKNLRDMLNTAQAYRPSCDMREPAMELIADAYDAYAKAYGDDRRAYRYGGK